MTNAGGDRNAGRDGNGGWGNGCVSCCFLLVFLYVLCSVFFSLFFFSNYLCATTGEAGARPDTADTGGDRNAGREGTLRMDFAK